MKKSVEKREEYIMEVQVIWGLFIFGMFFLVIKLLFGLIFDGSSDINCNVDDESNFNNDPYSTNESLFIKESPMLTDSIFSNYYGPLSDGDNADNHNL